MENWAKTFQKICRKRRSKYVWIFFGTILGIFDILKVFGNLKNLIFLKIFEDSTFHGKLGKNFSKSLPQNTSKLVWILLGTILVVSGILKNFVFFLKTFKESTIRGKLGKNFSKNLPQKTFKIRLDTFGNDFGHF